MARLVEYASKLAGSHKKLSTRFDDLTQVVGEAATWAKISKSKVVTSKFIDKALEEAEEEANNPNTKCYSHEEMKQMARRIIDGK